MSEGRLDVWLLDFAAGHDPAAALTRAFGLDRARAERILASLPRVVRHGASPLEAEETAAALRILGAKVDIRPASPGATSSGTELVRLERRRAAARTLDDDDPMADAEGATSEGARAAELRLDLDAPLEMGRGVGAAPAPARIVAKPAAVAPSARPEASLDPLDPFAAGGESLELAEVAPREQVPSAPKPASRAGVDAAAIERIEQMRREEDDPDAAKPGSARSLLASIPPWVLRATGITVATVIVLVGLRMAGRAWVRRDTPIEVATVTDEERSFASAVEMDAFLSREGASLGIERDRNLRLSSQLRSSGAVRVLAADIVEVGGRSVATTLIVELPASPVRRRRVMTVIESHRARTEVDPATVQLPPPEQRHVLLSLD